MVCFYQAGTFNVHLRDRRDRIGEMSNPLDYSASGDEIESSQQSGDDIDRFTSRREFKVCVEDGAHGS